MISVMILVGVGVRVILCYKMTMDLPLTRSFGDGIDGDKDGLGEYLADGSSGSG